VDDGDAANHTDNIRRSGNHDREPQLTANPALAIFVHDQQ